MPNLRASTRAGRANSEKASYRLHPPKHPGSIMLRIVQDYHGDPRRAVVLLSGGIDSFACAHFLHRNQFAVSAVFVDFGQAAAIQESAATARICERLEMERTVIRIGSEQTSRFQAGEIPARNLALLAAATLFTQGPRVVAIGIHAGTEYFDCSPAFLAQADRLLVECTGGTVSLIAPFLHWAKQEVVAYAQSEGLELALTYSCERGTVPPCGTCLSCKDRKALKC